MREYDETTAEEVFCLILAKAWRSNSALDPNEYNDDVISLFNFPSSGAMLAPGTKHHHYTTFWKLLGSQKTRLEETNLCRAWQVSRFH